MAEIQISTKRQIQICKFTKTNKKLQLQKYRNPNDFVKGERWSPVGAKLFGSDQ